MKLTAAINIVVDSIVVGALQCFWFGFSWGFFHGQDIWLAIFWFRTRKFFRSVAILLTFPINEESDWPPFQPNFLAHAYVLARDLILAWSVLQPLLWQVYPALQHKLQCQYTPQA